MTENGNTLESTHERVPQRLDARNEPLRPDVGFFFVGGHRRSGTTWLASMLGSHPAIAIRNEGWMINEWGRSVEQWFNDEAFEKWVALPSTPASWLKDMDAAEARRFAMRGMMEGIMREAVRRAYRNNPDRVRLIGDKTTVFLSTKSDLLHELFPDGKFIDIVRDGRDVVVSDLFLKFRYKDFQSFGPEGEPGARRAHAYHVEGVEPHVPLFQESVLRQLVRQWVRTLEGSGNAASLFHDSYRRIRYEDLRREPELLAELFGFLGVHSGPQILELCIDRNTFERQTKGRKAGDEKPLSFKRKGIVGDWKNYFTERDKDLFKELAGQQLIDLGYERDLDW